MQDAERIVGQVMRRRLRRRTMLGMAGGAAVVLAIGTGEATVPALLAAQGSGGGLGTVPTYPRVLAVGDSVTFGSIASLPNNAYAYQVIQGLRARSNSSAMFYLLHGAPGVRTADVITAYQQMSLAPVVDLIVVELGTDDFTQGTAPATFQAQYVSLLGLLRQAAPNAALVGLGTWSDPAAASLYNAIIQDAILNHSGTGVRRYVELGSLYLTAANHNPTGDTFHPNDTGHAAIASAILAVLP